MRWFLEGDRWSDEPDWNKAEAGKVTVTGENLAGEAAARLPAFLQHHGHLLHALTLESRYLAPDVRLQLDQLDWANCMPHLERLWIKGARLDASVFALPRLQLLNLQECTIESEQAVQLGLQAEGPGRHLQNLSIYHCHIASSMLTFGPHTELQDFDYRLDEEFARAWPVTFTFDGCPLLQNISFELCGAFDIVLAGTLPRLDELRLDATRSGMAGIDSSRLTETSFRLNQMIYV